MKLDRKKCACLVASVLALSCTFIVPKMSAKADEPLPVEGVAAVSETEIRYTGPGATNRYDDNAATFASDVDGEKIIIRIESTLTTRLPTVCLCIRLTEL